MVSDDLVGEVGIEAHARPERYQLGFVMEMEGTHASATGRLVRKPKAMVLRPDIAAVAVMKSLFRPSNVSEVKFTVILRLTQQALIVFGIDIADRIIGIRAGTHTSPTTLS